MFRFIQPLERRTLLTATATSIATELAAINTASAKVKTDLATIKSTAKLDLKAIAKDLKGSPASNAPLLKKLTTDETKFLTKVGADVTALLKGATLATHAAADGNAVIKTPFNALLQPKITADVKLLGTVSATPLGMLTADGSTATVAADFDALTAANPSLPTLIAADNTAKSHLNSGITTLLSDSTKFSNTLGVLKNDLTTLLPVPTTSPSLVGDYKGTIKTKGIVFGLGSVTVPLEINVTGQTINSLTGTITVDNTNTGSGTITVVELTNGKVTFKVNNTGFSVILVGVINVTTNSKGLLPGSVINGAGTFDISLFKVSGSFSVTKVT